MVIKSTLGYVLGGLGVIGIAAWAIPSFKTAIPQMHLVNDTALIIVSVILAGVGIFLITKAGGGRRRGRDVPIYEGNQIVGYRRHKK